MATNKGENEQYYSGDALTTEVAMGAEYNQSMADAFEAGIDNYVDSQVAAVGNALTTLNFSEDSMAFLKENAIDSGKNFLKGMATTAFSAQIDLYNNTKAAGAKGLQLLKDSPHIVADIVTSTTEYVVSYSVNYLTNATLTLIDPAPWTEGIAYYTSYYTELSMATASEMLMEYFQKQDDVINKRIEDATKAAGTEAMDESSYKLAQFTGAVQATTAYVSDAVNLVLTYIETGPDWVTKQINSYVDKGLGFVTSYIDLVVDGFVDARDAAITDIGELAGEAIAEGLNNATKKAQKKIAEATYKKTRNASLKAQAKLTKTTAKIVAKLGPLAGKAIKAAMKLAMNGLKKGLDAALSALQDQITSGIDKMNSAIEEGVNKAADTVSSKIDEGLDKIGIE